MDLIALTSREDTSVNARRERSATRTVLGAQESNHANAHLMTTAKTTLPASKEVVSIPATMFLAVQTPTVNRINMHLGVDASLVSSRERRANVFHVIIFLFWMKK